MRKHLLMLMSMLVLTLAGFSIASADSKTISSVDLKPQAATTDVLANPNMINSARYSKGSTNFSVTANTAGDISLTSFAKRDVTGYSVTPGVPEPSTLVLAGTGLLFMLGRRRRRAQ